MVALLAQLLFIACLISGQAFAKNIQKPEGQAFNFADLVRLIESQNIRDIDTLLAACP